MLMFLIYAYLVFLFFSVINMICSYKDYGYVIPSAIILFFVCLFGIFFLVSLFHTTGVIL